jgi:hypothetical protein
MQIPAEFNLRIIADVNDAILAVFAAFNPDSVAAKINGIDGKLEVLLGIFDLRLFL